MFEFTDKQPQNDRLREIYTASQFWQSLQKQTFLLKVTWVRFKITLSKYISAEDTVPFLWLITLSINPIFFICLLVRPSTTVLVSLLMWPLGKMNGWPLHPPPSLDQKTEWAAKSDNNEEAWWEVKRRPAPYQDCWGPVGRQGWLQWRLHKRGGGQRGWLDYVIGLCKAGFKRDNASFGVCWWCVYARAKW